AMSLIQFADRLADAGDRTAAEALVEEAFGLGARLPGGNGRDEVMWFGTVVLGERVSAAKALEAVSRIPSENSRLNALRDIATAQAEAGDLAGALLTVERLQGAHGNFRLKPWRAIAAAQLKEGDRAAAEATLAKCLAVVEQNRAQK